MWFLYFKEIGAVLLSIISLFHTAVLSVYQLIRVNVGLTSEPTSEGK